MNYCILEKFAEAVLEPQPLEDESERFERFMTNRIFEPAGVHDVMCLHELEPVDQNVGPAPARPELTLTYNAASPAIEGAGFPWGGPDAFGACSQGGLLLSARELRLFLDWIDEQGTSDPEFLVAWRGDCVPFPAAPSSLHRRCLGLVRKPTVAGSYFIHNGGLDCCGWRGMGSWAASFPFAINVAVVVNSLPSAADDPTTTANEARCPCADEHHAFYYGPTCPSVLPACPDLPMRDAEGIIVECFEKAVHLENLVDPSPG
jgi:hypothetical protein